VNSISIHSLGETRIVLPSPAGLQIPVLSDGEGGYSTPFYFEKNVGQARPGLDFVARGPGYTLGLSPTEAMFVVQNSMSVGAQNSEFRNQNPECGAGRAQNSEYRKQNSEWGGLASGASRGLDAPYAPPSPLPLSREGRGEMSPLSPPGRGDGGEGEIVRMHILGGDANAPATGLDPLITKVNYFLGNDPNHWHTNVPTFGKVHYDDIYPGIDLVYYSTQNSEFRIQNSESKQSALEYDFIVAPGADPNQIRLSFSGADSVTLDADGNLVLQVGDAQIRQQKPYIYQDINGARQQVQGEFRIQDSEQNSESRIQNSEQNSESRIQNSESSRATDCCLLSTVYFSVGAYDPSRPLIIDPVVQRGETYLGYSTYLGGPGYDYGYDIAVDQYGSAYVTGEAGSGFPLINPGQSYGGGKDAFVSKFSADGSTLLYSTYIGGSYEDVAGSVAIGKNSVYITGYTLSGDFPSTPGAFQPANADGTCLGNVDCADAFVTRLAPDGASLIYSTYLGTIYTESGDGIAVDASGNAYVMGQTNSADFPTVNAVQPAYGGGSCNQGTYFYPCYDVFVTKLNPSGSALVYSTYLGGNRDEAFFFNQVGDIAIDAAGHAYVTGYTESYTFPTYQALKPVKDPGRDAFVSKLSPDGSSFIFSTFLGGGEAGEQGFGIASDVAGNAYITGATGSVDFPTTPGAFQQVLSDDAEAFITKLSPSGSAYVYSTFLGGSGSEYGQGIAIDAQGKAYVIGWTESTDFPTRNAFQPGFAGNLDVFVSKLEPTGSALAYSSFLGGASGGSGTNEGVNGGGAIAIDPVGNAYLVGHTHTINFPIVRAFQAQNAGKSDVFLTKVSVSGANPL
jgi:hypothetical protein